MDPAERLSLQTDIGKLLEVARKDFDVCETLHKADLAIKARKWEDAKNLYIAAAGSFTPDVPISTLLANSNFCPSRASARRDIKAGYVALNGVILRRVDAYAGAGDAVSYKGKLVHGKG